jgi:integrase
MQNALYLTASRHGVFYFRFPIPPSFDPEGRRSSLRLSLGTRCPKEALHLARGLCYVGEYLLSHMKAASMDYLAIRQFLTHLFKERLEAMQQRIGQYGQLPALDVVALQNGRGFAKQELQEKSYHYTGTDAQMDVLIEQYDLPVSKPSEQYELLRGEFIKAFHSYCQKALDANSAFDDYDFEAAPAMPVRKPKGRTLEVAVAAYMAEKIELKEWRDRSLIDYQGKFDLLLRYLGKDRRLELPLEVAISIKDMLRHIPMRINTLPEYKNKSLEELMKLEGKRLSPVTVNKILQAYSGLYDWLVKRGEVKENHFKGLLHKVKKASKLRKGFEQEDIQRILSVVSEAKKGANKWGVLLAFYTGARLNEIAQLDVADIAEIEGVWCIRITDAGSDKKQLKTDSSKRDIPIHSKLIEMGFLDYVQQQGKGKRLFPSLSYHPKDGYGRNLGRWFNASLLRKQLAITDTALVFHSIRHTVANRLRNERVPEATIKDILGHSHSDVTMSVYATDLDKAIMKEAIEKLDYGFVAPQREAVDPLCLP